ncbi:MAG: hypothetical protein COW01_11980 [Bdellovibrionales bacterium CG12_big_fil_rev_8_21_14_0_65_38_15]|nr:MAG: hypothetical protein COW79_01260 [Bdellovibrionales bacterium CG22_combo_CG10-13_8_21_14_all_38_13]PIQ54052.1 MAG: hypothetical protein COW01_11980 [Bdellovibrionales bacterium CG12_big_fil_rev_8_21_14_0_65_38_15]PIR28577.1 MAG: hypothetical protein COV38_14980 [Bdellovibrionales bacterium CG11_big_fil_rev_8_21_14_0_20_38_13]
MHKLLSWHKILIVFIVTLFLVGGLSYYFYRNYLDDRTTTEEANVGIVNLRRGMTKIAIAKSNMRVASYLVGYISKCKRFPENLQGFYKPIEGEKPTSCNPFPVNVKKPWLDPWGRSYEIRYDRDRKKLQIRSLGRYWWWPWDNIQDETNLAVPTDLVEPERQKCDQGLDCIYSRGWH